MDLDDFDLNLLKVFDAVMAERGVSRAARRLGLTQSAVSNALARLRRSFGDELFVRTPAGMEPTALARGLAKPVTAALDQMRGALTSMAPFDPAGSSHRFIIGMADHAEFLFAPPLASCLAHEAPNARLTIRAVDRDRVLDMIDGDVVTLAIGVLPDAPPHMTRIVLMRQRLAVVMRTDHPAAAAPLDLDTYLAFDHVLVSAVGSEVGAVDRALAAIGRRRRLQLVASHLLAAAAMVAGDTLLCTLPERVAHALAAPFGLTVRPVPLDMPGSAATTMIWHRRHDSDGAHVWLRRRLAAIARPIAAATAPDAGSPGP